jgi:hypothetical protein
MLSFCKSHPVSSFKSICLILKGLWEQGKNGQGMILRYKCSG